MDAAGHRRGCRRLGHCRVCAGGGVQDRFRRYSPASSAPRCLFGGDRWNLGTNCRAAAAWRSTASSPACFRRWWASAAARFRTRCSRSTASRCSGAVATSAGIGVPITIAGTIGYMLAGWPHMAQLPPLSIGFVSLVGFVLMAPVSSYTTSLWRAAGALAAAAQARDRFRNVSCCWCRCGFSPSLL